MVVLEESSMKTVGKFYEKTAIILIIKIAAQMAPKSVATTKQPKIELLVIIALARTTQKFILVLAAIWKIDEESSTTKPKGFAYNGCFRQFAKKSPLVVATLTPSAR